MPHLAVTQLLLPDDCLNPALIPCSSIRVCAMLVREYTGFLIVSSTVKYVLSLQCIIYCNTCIPNFVLAKRHIKIFQYPKGNNCITQYSCCFVMVLPLKILQLMQEIYASPGIWWPMHSVLTDYVHKLLEPCTSPHCNPCMRSCSLCKKYVQVQEVLVLIRR